jgi:adenosylmethionine-8-amino-7-oxononanoate aminotransferase
MAIGLQLHGLSAAGLCRASRGRGALVRPVGHDDVLPLMPPLTIDAQLADQLVESCCEAITAHQSQAPPSEVIV